MKQIDLLRSMPIEEVARDRVKFVLGDWLTADSYEGDFGVVKVRGGRYVNNNEPYAEAWHEALRLEVEFLNSEAEGEK